LARLKELPALKSLFLDAFDKSGRVTQQGYEAVTALPLTYLRLTSHVGFNGKAMRGFENMRQLTDLILFGKLEDSMLREVAKAPQLRFLSVQGNQLITDAGLVHLEGMKSLRHLSLGGAQVTEAGAKKLSNALPWCRIDLGNGRFIAPREKPPATAAPVEKPAVPAGDSQRQATQVLLTLFELDIKLISSGEVIKPKPQALLAISKGT
jgi:hypothetical protein